MRKITLFLALMLTCVSTVMAQWSGKGIASVSETPATTLTDGYYVIYNNGRGTFLNTEGALGQAKVTWPTTANATGVAALASADALNNSSGSTNKMAYVFYVNVEGSTMSLKTGYEDYVPVLTANVTFNYVADEAFWNYEVVEGGFVFLKGETVGLDCNGWTASDHTYSTAAGWTADGSKNTNGNQSWSFYAVDLKDVAEVNVTYNYQLNGVTKKTETIVQIVGDAYAAPAIDYVTFAQPEGVVPAGGATINVACSENLPFAVTTDLNTPIWQTVEMHRYGTFRVWEYDGQDKEVKVTNINKEEGVADAMLWCFTGNIFDGFKIYNKAAGTGVTLNATASNATVGTAAEGNDVWKLKVGAASADVAACFTNDGVNYMNHQDGVIKYWGSNDNGSTCYFYAPGQLVYEAATEFFGIPEGVVGSYLLEEEVEVAINDLCALGVDELIAKSVEEVQIAAQTVKDARASEQVAYADGYYRIYSAQPGLYANNKGLIYNVAGSASNPFRWGTIEETNVDAIVRLTTDNGKVVLQTVNTALYVQGVLGASNPNMTDNGHITLTPLGFAQYNLVFGNGTMHAEGHGEGAGSEGALVNWGGSVNSASAWYLVPATELEVALNVFEGASYATGYYPFPVSANGNTTLNVGVLNADKSKLGLAAVDGVPANTGVVIVNSAAEPTTTLTIGGEFEAAGSNALTGSCTAVTENIENYLVLGVGATTGALGFYETTATEIPANKAFLEAGSLSAVKLDLGGDVTAIESVELGNTNAPIFDLSGRRVLTPAKGGVYIQDGKKFIVK